MKNRKAPKAAPQPNLDEYGNEIPKVTRTKRPLAESIAARLAHIDGQIATRRDEIATLERKRSDLVDGFEKRAKAISDAVAAATNLSLAPQVRSASDE